MAWYYPLHNSSAKRELKIGLRGLDHSPVLHVIPGIWRYFADQMPFLTSNHSIRRRASGVISSWIVFCSLIWSWRWQEAKFTILKETQSRRMNTYVSSLRYTIHIGAVGLFKGAPSTHRGNIYRCQKRFDFRPYFIWPGNFLMRENLTKYIRIIWNYCVFSSVSAMTSRVFSLTSALASTALASAPRPRLGLGFFAAVVNRISCPT